MSTHKRASPSVETPTSLSTEPGAQGLSITALAQEFDLTTRAIRFYEDMGLLTPWRVGRRRLYSQRDRTRLKLTLRGKRLGLSLLEIRQLVDMYESPSDTTAQLSAFLEVLSRHRHDLEQQREDIEITLAEISQHEARCRQLLTADRSRRRPVKPAADPFLAASPVTSDPHPDQETLP
jgi:DNA-binding transcriptional MerR regulator